MLSPKCYGGIFPCYTPGGVEDRFVLSGLFTGDDLFQVNIMFTKYCYENDKKLVNEHILSLADDLGLRVKEVNL